MTNLNPDQISAISRFFSSRVLQEMAKDRKSSLFSRLLRDSDLCRVSPNINTVADAFDVSFSFLKHKMHRHEYVYKAALTEKVLLGRHNLQTASMVTEFRAGCSKVDYVVLNGTATAYEIKSERDNLSKLEKQICDYLKVFAKVNVIVGDNHCNEVLDILPEEVGVLRLSDRYNISNIREAKELPERTDPLSILQSIRLKEAKMMLENLGLDVPNVPNTKMYYEIQKRFALLESIDVHREMVKVLKITRDLRPLKDILEEIPHSLKTLMLSTNIRKRDHENLIFAINTPINNATQWA